MMIYLINSSGTFDITQLVNQVTVSGDYQQCARTLTASILINSMDKTIPSFSIKNGDRIKVFENKGADLVFSGIIESRAKTTESSLLEITAFDGGRVLKRNSDNLKASGITPESLIRTLANKFQISVGYVEKTGVKLKKNFFGVSLYDMMQSAYTTAGEQLNKKYIIRFEGEKLCVREKSKTTGLPMLGNKVNILTSNVTESIANMVNQVVIVDKNNKTLKTLNNAEDITAYGLAQVILKQGDEDISGQAKQALEDGREQQKITVTNFGNVHYITGNSIMIKEPVTGLSGLFWIDSDSHIWKNGIYQNKLTLNFRNLMDEKKSGEDA